MRLFFRLSICSYAVFLVNCENQNEGSGLTDNPSAWVGTESEFADQFELETDVNNSITLINAKTKKKFEGLLVTEDLNASREKRYLDGKLNGLSIFSSKDGSRVEAHYQNGILHGEMIMYDKNNRIRSRINYNKGVVTPVIE